MRDSGARASTLTLFMRWDGTLHTASDYASQWTSASMGFCTGPVGYCNSPNPACYLQTFRGGASAYTYINGGSGDAVSTYGSAPTGFTAPEVLLDGTGTRDSDAGSASALVDGWLTLANIPIGGTEPYDFHFWFTTWGELGLWGGGDTPVTGALAADFAHTLELSGAVAHDAAGNLIPDATITLGSASNLPTGRPAGAPIPPPAPNLATPEPATLALLAGGLAVPPLGARRTA